MVLFGFFVIPLIVIVKHHQNIRRLLAGTDRRAGLVAVSAPVAGAFNAEIYARLREQIPPGQPV